MGRRIRRFTAVAAAVALSTALGGSAATSAVPRQGEGPETGLTDDSIKIAYVYGDTTALQQSGVLAFTGDGGEQFRTFADLANEAGGAAGRQLDVTTHLFVVPSTATDERAACVAATEDDQAFIVVYHGGQSEESLLCAAEEHGRITIAIASNTRASAYKAAEGRLFTNDMSATRLMKNWVKAVKKEGLLAGDPAIGIVRPDFSTHAELARTLTKALTKAGFEVVEEVALPCDAPISPCQQVDVGALRLQTRNVDTVFSLLGALAYPELVGAARDIRFEPQWLSSDFEFQVYDTVLMFMEDVKGDYDGAVGISTILDIERPDGPRTECNERWVQAGGEEYEPLSDAWQNVGTNCLLADRIVRAANAAQEAGRLTQESFIREFEKLPLVEGKRQGSYTAKKHDAYDAYQLYEFDAGCLCWEPIKGSVTDEG